MNVDDTEMVSANWTLATNDDNVANSNRLVWIGAYVLVFRTPIHLYVDKLMHKNSKCDK